MGVEEEGGWEGARFKRTGDIIGKLLDLPHANDLPNGVLDYLCVPHVL